jgi:hypothetical protein
LYLKKGGNIDDTVGRKCLCNGLMANIDLPQYRKNGSIEKPLVTAGDDFKNISRFLKDGANSYSAEDVINYLLGHVPLEEESKLGVSQFSVRSS